MRPMLVISGSIAALVLTGVLAWTRLAPAQTPAPLGAAPAGETMTITAAAGVEVRSGPSDKFYATSKLRYGDTVKVIPKGDKTYSGWLAIEPPSGSQSWINADFVKPSSTNPNQGIVYCDENAPVPIKPASYLTGQEPNVESAKLARGTQVVIVGPTLFKSNAHWLPIQAPAGDRRYIPESAVAKVAVVQVTTARSAAPQAGFVAGPGGDQSPLAAGDAALAKATQLYQQATSSTDPNQRAQAQSRLQMLQPVMAAQNAALQPGYPSTSSTNSPPRVALGGALVTGQTTAVNTGLSTASAGSDQWGKWGTLRKTSFLKDGQPMYRLEDERGAPLGYAMAAPGLTLEPYINRLVCLYGPTAYHSADTSLRANYTIAKQLSLANR